MDVTTQFNDCLSKAGSSPIEPFVFHLSALNEFLKEAYRIVILPSSTANYSL
jgi:hypothetical protein